MIAACAMASTTPEGIKYLAKNAKNKKVIVLPSGLQYKQLKKGKEDGLTPNRTSECYVHYRGKNIKGFEFDSSKKYGDAPRKFAPSAVIKGWTEALMMMKEGEKAEIVIPSELAYGARSMGEYITPGSVLIFELELVGVEPDSGGFDPIGYIKKLPYSIWAFIAYFAYNILFAGGGSAKAGKPMPAKEQRGKAGNKRVFIDISIKKEGKVEHSGRIEMELFNSITPKTADNFYHLCTGSKGMGKCGKPLHFKNSKFHRIIPGFMAQGGDFQNGDGTGGESIYGSKFEDEFDEKAGFVSHSEKYVLSMANSGSNSNGSQFFITFVNTSFLDGKHVVFGQVVKGAETVEAMQKQGSQTGSVAAEVIVQDCGALDSATNDTSPAVAAVDNTETVLQSRKRHPAAASSTTSDGADDNVPAGASPNFQQDTKKHN